MPLARTPDVAPVLGIGASGVSLVARADTAREALAASGRRKLCLYVDADGIAQEPKFVEAARRHALSSFGSNIEQP